MLNWSAVAAVIGFVTLAVVCYQVRLMILQTRILKRQDDFLARKADLEIVLAPPESERDNRLQFVFHARNKGSKGASDYYWNIFVSTAAATNIVSNHIQMGGGYAAEIEAVGYREFRGHADSPLYPNRQTIIGSVEFVGPQLGHHTIFWKLVADDGVFPSDPDFGRFEVELNDNLIVITKPGSPSVTVRRNRT